MFKRLFKPKEVKAALLALGLEQQRIYSNDAFMLHPAFDAIKGEVRDVLVKESEKTVASINKDGLSPRVLVLLIMTNVLDPKLSFGENHVYRGSLSMLGQGLLNLWSYATDQLLEEGFFDQHEAEDQKKYINDQIKKVG